MATTVPRSSPSYSNPGWSAGGGESPRLRRRGEGAGALPAGRMPPADLRFESWPLSRTHMGRGIWTAVSCQSRRSKEAERGCRQARRGRGCGGQVGCAAGSAHWEGGQRCRCRASQCCVKVAGKVVQSQGGRRVARERCARRSVAVLGERGAASVGAMGRALCLCRHCAGRCRADHSFHAVACAMGGAVRGGAARRAARRGAEEVVRRRGDARRRIIGARPRAGAQGCACVTWKSAVLGVFVVADI